MNGIYNNISPVINTAPQAWIDQQTLRGIGSNRSRLYVDPNGDLWGQFENNPPKKIANLGGTGSESATGVPVGAVFQWIGGVAPAGYLMCDGNAVSGMYPQLLALLTSYGGKTPDLRGRFVIGASTTSPSYTSSFPGPLQLMANGGNFETALDIQHLPEHSHEIEEEAESSHTHTFDLENHTHSVSTQTLTGHSHSVDSPDATVTHWTGSAWDSQGNDGSTGDNDAWEPSFDTSTWTNSVEDSDGGEFHVEVPGDTDNTVTSEGTWDTDDPEVVTTTLAMDDSGSAQHGDFIGNEWGGYYVWNWTATSNTYYVDGHLADGSITVENITDIDFSLDNASNEDTPPYDMTGDDFNASYDHVSQIDHKHEVTLTDHTHEVEVANHTHEIPIANLHHTHALTDTAHYHSFDVDLSASTNSTNNGAVSWVGQMGATGTAAEAGGVTNEETSVFYEPAHAHGGRTGNAGLSTPDPVQSLPPYIALNFIIKHD